MGRYTCQNSTLYGNNSKAIYLRINRFASYGAANTIIYSPNGNNTILAIYSEFAVYSLANSIIYASDTTKIELFGSGDERFRGVKLYAYHSQSIFIECNEQTGACFDMKIYIHDDSFNISDPYPENRLYMECVTENDCIGAQLIVSNNITDTWTCSFIFNNSKWYCNDHEISWNTVNPTPLPTSKPTSNTNEPTKSPTILTVHPTSIPSEYPTETNSKVIYIQTKKEYQLILWIVGIVAVLCFFVSLFQAVLLIKLQKKMNKSVDDAAIINASPPQSSKDPDSPIIYSNNMTSKNIVFSNESINVNDIPLPKSKSTVNGSIEMLYDPNLKSPKTNGNIGIKYGERSTISGKTLSPPGNGTKNEDIISMKPSFVNKQTKHDNAFENNYDDDIDIIMDDDTKMF